MKAFMTHQELANRCPAIFSGPSPEVGKHYTHVPTHKMINILEEIGYLPVKAMQKGRSPYGKHIVRLRHSDYLDLGKRVDDILPEIVMINSHDTTSVFDILFGIFRVVCANGMIVSDGPVKQKRFRHISVEKEMLMTVDELKEFSPQVFDDIRKMKAIDLSELEVLEFADEATTFRYAFPVEREKILAVRRPEDEGRSLWNVLSRVQENLIKGGYEVTNKRPVEAKEITNVDADLSINRKLWDLANRWVEQKISG